MKLKSILLILTLAGNPSLFAQTWYAPEVDAKVSSLIGRKTIDEKLDFVCGAPRMTSTPVERIGIQPIQMSDGPQGLGTNGQSTAYPAKVLLTHAINIYIYRAPMCGRNFEYMGKDLYLAGSMATNYVRGVQRQGVVATIKHFMGNNSDYDRHDISNDIDERAMHEIYLPTFKTVNLNYTGK